MKDVKQYLFEWTEFKQIKNPKHFQLLSSFFFYYLFQENEGIHSISSKQNELVEKVEKFKRKQSTNSTTTLTQLEASIENTEDTFDIIGKSVANKLRQMNAVTSVLAQNLINQVLFEAQLGNLNSNSSLMLNLQ